MLIPFSLVYTMVGLTLELHLLLRLLVGQNVLLLSIDPRDFEIIIGL